MFLYRERFEVLSFAVSSAPTEGLILEFGVASGATINYLAATVALHERTIYGFDSFRGLPEPWGAYPVGHFACEPPAVAPNVELFVGLFSDTLPRFLQTHPGNAALIHIDCDLYSSTKTVLELLTPRIVSGTHIAFDEYFCVIEHEQRAFQDWLLAHDRKCIPLARSYEQLVVLME